MKKEKLVCSICGSEIKFTSFNICYSTCDCMPSSEGNGIVAAMLESEYLKIKEITNE